MQTIEQIREIMTEFLTTCGIYVTPEILQTPLESLDIDSLDLIEIQLIFEEEYPNTLNHEKKFHDLFYLEYTPEYIITQIYKLIQI